MKANEVKNFGQLEQFLDEEAKGVEIGRDTWVNFYELENIAKRVDKAFCIKPIPRERRNTQTRYLCYGTLYLGQITFKTANGKFKEVTLHCVHKDKTWLDAVSADEQRKEAEEAKAVELLKERGFEDLDELISYLNELPKSKRDKIKLSLRTY